MALYRASSTTRSATRTVDAAAAELFSRARSSVCDITANKVLKVSPSEEWRKRYDIRAGIEGTNSELKRAHGLGRLRVRGGRRVRLAVYLKALACNFKRMVHARLVEMENTAQRAVGTVPAVAAA